MQLLLRISRFCNPQRKHRKPSTYVQSPGGRVVNVDKGFISVLVVKSFYKLFYFISFCYRKISDQGSLVMVALPVAVY